MVVQNLGILKNAYSNDGTFMQYKGFWKFNTYYEQPPFLHMKTNINQTNMWMIEALGYSYCGATKIRSAWTFHWDGNSLYNISYSYLGGYGGLRPNNVYMSVDGYVVIVAVFNCTGYVGFMLNGYNTADVYTQNLLAVTGPRVTASAHSYNNYGVY